MSQSLSKLFVHIIFHIKSASVEIRKDEANELYAYIGSILKDLNCIPVLVNGISNHIHILCVMSKNIALAKLVEDVKRHSSRWIKTKSTYYAKFAWQGGYAGFSVNPSLYEKTRKYIENQEEHHKKMTFQEEYLIFLKEYGIEYDENYLWTD